MACGYGERKLIGDKPQSDKAGQASPAFRQIGESGSREEVKVGMEFDNSLLSYFTRTPEVPVLYRPAVVYWGYSTIKIFLTQSHQ